MKVNAYKRIRQAMRRNEREILTHLKEINCNDFFLWSPAWVKAFKRLDQAGQIRRVGVISRYWKPRKGARPITQ